MSPDLSIILPTYHGGELLKKHLPDLIEYISKQTFSAEIIIVDDGSNDRQNTKQVADTHRCRYIKNERNLGKGAAVRRGMLAAQGQVHLFTDADIPYSLHSIKAFFETIQQGDYHIAVGDRNLADSDYFRRIPGLRNLGSRMFNLFVGTILHGKRFDTQCGIKAFSSEVSREIFALSTIDRFAFDVELLLIAIRRGYLIQQLPVELRMWEPSGINIARDGTQMLFDLIRIKSNELRGRYDPETLL